VIKEIIIIAEHPDGLHEAQEEVNEVISRVMSGALTVNPPGEWELTNEQDSEPITPPGMASRTPFSTRQVFTFSEHDNVPVGGKPHGS
jgi:hypothetical protein